MKEDEVIELIRHYRHDWLNDLQLMMGYAQLGKLDKVQNKIEDVMERTNIERELDRLDIPKTMIWLLRLNWQSETINLSFRIHVNKRPEPLSDRLMCAHFETIFSILAPFQIEYQQYHGDVLFSESNDHHIHIQLQFEASWNDEAELMAQLKKQSFIHSVTINQDKQLQVNWLE